MSSRYSTVPQSPIDPFIQSPMTADEDYGVASQDRVFEELLDAEVAVNLEKLREAARMGIPPAYRGVVYRYLLGVAFTDKSSEMTMEELQDKDFQLLRGAYTRIWGGADEDDDRGDAGGGADIGGGRGTSSKVAATNALKTLLAFSTSSTASAVGATNLSGPLQTRLSSDDADCSRCPLHMPFTYRSSSAVLSHTPSATLAAWEEALAALRHAVPYNHDARQRAKIESAVAALQVMYSAVSIDHVQLLVLFARQLDLISSTARDTFFTVNALYQVLTRERNILHGERALQLHCANFLMLFRATLPPLYEHFLAEGVTTWEWVPSLLTSFFASRMHPDDVCALWDYYLADKSEHQAMGLHPYACLATLSALTELLIEAEKTELLYCLEHLPRIDTAAIMRKAVLIRESVYSKGLLA
ncbi:hypothetical protein ABB37_05640 [Leptomonas pyrrhocoris]|uniref:Rab-GAP TBC domain-containing protein n=1 Tax=Leptomonas pyrrhocoris TaxID=157538 RepID=A0A0M9FZJ0_LEPPY|nr:hypothetical protein ABB37_05640 [Leptomonas pyrrhocoris]KPA79129.1 hypothetical protein ABB37_05640 [Leptomonas pyrrhocoris]|eukprot:XP_015657568.1 hypothetical protein ABB37_05640 [Leptomonas pyrrhocoris]